MYICLCFDVSKVELKKAIRAGHDSIEKLSEHLQVGNHCGGCVGRIEEILEKNPFLKIIASTVIYAFKLC